MMTTAAVKYIVHLDLRKTSTVETPSEKGGPKCPKILYI